MNRAGKIVLVATPIGNLGDLSPRAVAALEGASLILAEDTRHSGKLLHHFGIKASVESFHDYNEDRRSESIIERVVAGEVIVLVSDAGTPLLSDPGFPLMRLARQRGVVVEPVPGPFAGIVALVASGLPSVPFTFYGFAPHRQGERLDFFRNMAGSRATSLVYESPLRIIDSLRDALSVLGDVEITVAREMTKIHEEFINGTVSEVISRLESRDTVRGEITIVIAPAGEAKAEKVSHEEITAEFNRLRGTGLRRNDAIKVVAEKFGLRKNDVYRSLL